MPCATSRLPGATPARQSASARNALEYQWIDCDWSRPGRRPSRMEIGAPREPPCFLGQLSGKVRGVETCRTDLSAKKRATPARTGAALDGARGRNRTGTPFGEGFSYHFGFRRQRMRCSWSGARLHHSLAAVGARRLLSTPSQTVAWAWLGVGSDAEASRAFADFDGLHFRRFPPKAQIVQVPCVYRFHHSGVVRNAQEHLLPSTGA